MSARRNRTFVKAWLTALLVAVAALALPAVGTAAEPGGFKGVVTGEGGASLADVEVCAEETTTEEFACEETNLDGEYEVSGLAAGQYKVHFRPAETANYVPQWYSDQPSWETATPVAVVAGAVTPNIDATLAKGAKINGVVTAAATGQPVAEVVVCAWGVNVEIFRCAESNGAGSYSVTGLAGGTYEVEFFPEETGQDLLASAYSLGVVTVDPQGEISGIDQALQAGGQITGTVRLAATGAPLAGVRVCVTEAAFLEPLACLTTPASGGYRFTGAWRGTFKVVFSAEASEFPDSKPVPDIYPTQWWQGAPSFAAATPIAVTPPGIVSGIDAALGPPAVVTPPPAAPVAPVTKVIPKPKPGTSGPRPLKCKKGFTKRKVHGKAKCVRRHHRKPAKRRHHHKKHAA